MFLRFVRAFLFILVVAFMAQAQQEATTVLAVTTEANATTVGVVRNPRVVAGKDHSLKQAYDDVFKILAAENTCSDFYGGPAVATTVLDRLISKVEPGVLPEFVSFQMIGRTQNVFDPHSGAYYRLFDRAIVNSEGAFYLRRFDAMQRRPRNVGSFAPGTRPARALILMHELGHLIRGRSGAWVIADDGNDSWQSKLNTAEVERNCGTQLRDLY